MNRSKFHTLTGSFFLFTLMFIIVPNFMNASGQQLKFKKCDPKALPLQLAGFDNKPQDIDFRCGNKGCHKSAANDKQNQAKNNFCAATDNIIPVTRETLKALQDKVNKMPGIPERTPPASRTKLKNIQLTDGTRLGEGNAVAFVGFVLDASHSNVDSKKPFTAGNGESVQCNFLGCPYNDIHVQLTGVKNDTTACQSVTAEIIPHYRPAAWDLFDSPDYTDFFKDHPVRLTGQLFFDGSHVACKNGKPGEFFVNGKKQTDFPRIAVWEIHPIYAIDVCKLTSKEACIADESAWIPFSKLQSHLNLATVHPTEKCSGPTPTNPVSKCATPAP
ncbi:MAG TPA: hypothetical protein DHU55_01355 [Blastocatellia bacterium]|jgi:hypothetical protein|nr:hypothetical protein [Blastocatellia bacterium]